MGRRIIDAKGNPIPKEEQLTYNPEENKEVITDPKISLQRALALYDEMYGDESQTKTPNKFEEQDKTITKKKPIKEKEDMSEATTATETTQVVPVKQEMPQQPKTTNRSRSASKPKTTPKKPATNAGMQILKKVIKLGDTNVTINVTNNRVVLETSVNRGKDGELVIQRTNHIEKPNENDNWKTVLNNFLECLSAMEI